MKGEGSRGGEGGGSGGGGSEGRTARTVSTRERGKSPPERAPWEEADVRNEPATRSLPYYAQYWEVVVVVVMVRTCV